ncbi:MAG: stage II sporulation protein M [Lachnospiraceae bacterium]
MRWLKESEEKKSHLLAGLVAVGFIIGLFLMNMGKKALLGDTGILNEYMLYEMKYSDVDSNAFFGYVLQKRLGAALLLAVLSTTWLGLAATWTCAAWMGVSFGMLVMAAMLRYGAKGILLILVGVFPQVLVYFPASLLLLQWSYEFCTAMYFPNRASKGAFTGGETVGKSFLIRKKILQFLLLLGVVIIGCALESYVNPKLVLNLLKIF